MQLSAYLVCKPALEVFLFNYLFRMKSIRVLELLITIYFLIWRLKLSLTFAFLRWEEFHFISVILN